MQERELRLALVCYGGISLAVYMHGITREVWHLTRASRAHADGDTMESEVERAYADFLGEIEQSGGAGLRILVDIVSGASAGGINGIFLAHAIATGQSLAPLTDLWLEKADVDELIDPEARMAGRFAKVWASPFIWAISGRLGNDDGALEPGAQAEMREKLARFMRSRWFEPPFGGRVFTTMLLDAFDAMARSDPGMRLLPDGHPLDLFVTVTDFHGHPETLTLNSPPTITENEHRTILSFREDGGGQGGLAEVVSLAFAARATASFPGAFPPMTVGEMDGVLDERDQPWPDRAAFLTRQFGRSQHPEAVVLIDGSVLSNAPFGPAIEALGRRPARREVIRRFVYIDPKPAIRSIGLARDSDEKPGFFTTIFGALSDLPREQPIRDNLDAIGQRSQRIARLNRIAALLQPEVEARMQGVMGKRWLMAKPTADRVRDWRIQIDRQAAEDTGIAYASYVALRLAALDPAADLAHATRTLLQRDRAYRLRRLRALARRLTALMEAGDDVGDARAAIYRLIGDASDEALPLDQVDALADSSVAAMAMAATRRVRRAILHSYLGFPHFDIATYAMFEGQGFDEFDAIRVDRISPDDAQTLRQGDARATLRGVELSSFGAFFSRAYRENDYLWGRLHGAERLVDIVASTLPAPSALGDERLREIKHRLFVAILLEERDRLPRVASQIDALLAQLGHSPGRSSSVGEDK